LAMTWRAGCRVPCKQTKPKLDSRSFSDHFWSGPAATEVGDDVDYATEVGDDCDCCWGAARWPGRPGATAPNHSRHPGLSNAKTKPSPGYRTPDLPSTSDQLLQLSQ
jgi:hypothetical protein